MAKQNGGARVGAGRKPKATELELIERLSPLDDIALKALAQGVRSGELGYVKLFMAYRFGNPKDTISFDNEFTLVVNRKVVDGRNNT